MRRLSEVRHTAPNIVARMTVPELSEESVYCRVRTGERSSHEMKLSASPSNLLESST